MKAAGDLVVATEADAVSGLDINTGVTRWRGGITAPNTVVTHDRVYAAGPHFVIAGVSLNHGLALWESQPVCSGPVSDRGPTARTLLALGNDLYVGCPKAQRLVRIDARTGKVLAARNVLPVYQFFGGMDLGHGVIAVAGASAGAVLQVHVVLVHRDDLRPLIDERTDTTVLGAVGDTAILDDWCCFGRMTVPAPATILRVDLRTGRMATPIDLQPDPKRFGPDQRPLGVGANAALVGSHLYFAIPPMLYDYGDALNPVAKPRAVFDSLVEPPVFLVNGRAFVRLRADGVITDEVVDLRSNPVREVWSRRSTSPYEQATCEATVCQPSRPGDLVILGTRPEEPALVVRWDGATAVVPSGCREFATSGQIVALGCAQPEARRGQ